MPENRNSGIMPNRKITANEVSLARVTAHASIGAVNATPVRTATGSVASAQGDCTAPSTAATARKMAQFMASRSVTNSTWPWNRSAGRSGGAAAAWEGLGHLTEAYPGEGDSPTAVVMAGGARRPGGGKNTGATPPRAARPGAVAPAPRRRAPAPRHT